MLLAKYIIKFSSVRCVVYTIQYYVNASGVAEWLLLPLIELVSALSLYLLLFRFLAIIEIGRFVFVDDWSDADDVIGCNGHDLSSSDRLNRSHVLRYTSVVLIRRTLLVL